MVWWIETIITNWPGNADGITTFIDGKLTNIDSITFIDGELTYIDGVIAYR